ncbi:MAG: hypothetical protein ABIQ99_05390, partial [Thermoflexales bacterium]
MNRFTLLDGALGTELTRRGCDTWLPLWSARYRRIQMAIAHAGTARVVVPLDALTRPPVRSTSPPRDLTG